MGGWYLNRALTNLRNEVNARYPNRDKTSDGTVGDLAHQATDSDHNPDPDGSVDAWDMDVDLRSGNDAAEIEKLKAVFQKHEAARYWIHNRQIAHRNNGWKRERYAGPNPHDKHVHWNSNQATETSNKPWFPQEEDMTQTEFNVLMRGLLDPNTKDPNAQMAQKYLRATPWQYVGGGIPKDLSTLNVLNETLQNSRDAAVPTTVTLDAKMLAAALGDPKFVEAVAKGVADEVAKRMAG